MLFAKMIFSFIGGYTSCILVSVINAFSVVEIWNELNLNVFIANKKFLEAGFQYFIN